MAKDISDKSKAALAGAVVWDLAWKGMAMWRAGRNRQPGWFTALLVVNSLGVLPIFYLLTHDERKHLQTKGD